MHSCIYHNKMKLSCSDILSMSYDYSQQASQSTYWGSRCNTRDMPCNVRANVVNLSRGYVCKLYRRNYCCASGARECNANAARRRVCGVNCGSYLPRSRFVTAMTQLMPFNYYLLPLRCDEGTKSFLGGAMFICHAGSVDKY